MNDSGPSSKKNGNEDFPPSERGLLTAHYITKNNDSPMNSATSSQYIELTQVKKGASPEKETFPHTRVPSNAYNGFP